MQNLIGQRYGDLVVTKYLQALPRWRHLWECRCDCGKVTPVRDTNLVSGNTKSCGHRRVAVTTASKTTHGCAGRGRQTAEYRIWAGLKYRCENPKSPGYHKYGGRGIRVCQRWSESFDAFRADMGPRPSAKHSIERKKNNGDYTPDNCCWATAKTQAQNRRQRKDALVATVDGRTQTLREWARETGIPYTTLSTRLARGKPIFK